MRHASWLNTAPPPDVAGDFRTDLAARQAYSESAGILRVIPDAVCAPREVHDLQRLCRWATATGTPLVPRGSGSSMAGGAVGPGVIVDLHALREAPVVHRAWGRVTTGIARTRAEVDAAARAAGLRFPVDPSSGAFATIGGMVACNAAGARTLAFGAMRAWVRSLECVFADGTQARVSRGMGPRPDDPPVLSRWWTGADALRARCAALPARGTRKESSGYGVHDFARSGDLVDLLVGSEGTLAFFTAAELDLTPLPAASASVLGSWPSIDAAVHAATLAREAGAVACEMLDASFLRLAARAHPLPVPDSSECVLLVELEGSAAEFVAERARALGRAWEASGASAVHLGLDPESAEALWALRHAASPILARLDEHVKSMQVIEDGCVPVSRLADYVRGVRAALAATGLDGVLFGHAGDAHLHVNALVDIRRPGWQEAVRQLYERVLDLTVALGGTASGEHGDGRLRSPALARFWSEDALAVFRTIKDHFDPARILNPGVKDPGAPGLLATVKYDASLPALAPEVRQILDEVERTRSWDASRLELLGVAKAGQAGA